MNRVSAVPISPRAPRSHQDFGLGVAAFHLNAGEIGTAKESSFYMDFLLPNQKIVLAVKLVK